MWLNDLFLGKRGHFWGGNGHFLVINDHFGGPKVRCGQILQKILARQANAPLHVNWAAQSSLYASVLYY